MRPFRIAIDATSIPPLPVGVGNYLIQLIRSLNELEFENEEYFIFIQKHSSKFLDFQNNNKIKLILVDDKSVVERLIWEQVVFPKLLKKYCIDLVHSPHYTIPIFTKCRRVVTFHDMSFFLFPQFHQFSKRIFFQKMIRVSSRLADSIIAISENTRKDVIRLLNVPNSKITTIPLGVSSEFRPINDTNFLEQIKKRYQLPEHFFLYVGTLEPRKNIQLLVKAFQYYLEQGGNSKLILVGQKGWKLNHFIKSLNSSMPDQSIRWLGYIPHQHLPALYNLAIGLLYPTNYEGFGLPPLEAMACGLPVISTSVPVIEEVVGDAGILVDPNDEIGLVHAISSLAENDELRNILREQGKIRASHYSWHHTALLTRDIYWKILKDKNHLTNP